MLKQRVLTALILLAVLLPSLWATSPWPFAAFVAITMLAAGWEWARLNGWQGGRALLYGVALLGIGFALKGAATEVSVWPPLIAVAWILAGSWALKAGVPVWAKLPSSLRLAVGPLVLLPAGWALIAWKSLGLNALLSVLCLVWMADVAAYFSGRLFGRRKLAPAISPGKSWEGVWGGVLGVMMMAVVWVIWIDPLMAPRYGLSLYGQLQAGLGWVITILAILVLVMLSVMGDLFESLVKRAAGAKDSSQLLPGHGGVLDRIDALLPVLPASLALFVLSQGMRA